jgi:hypothetical protein
MGPPHHLSTSRTGPDVSRLGIPPLAHVYASRVTGERLTYQFKIERLGADGVLNPDTGLLDAPERFQIYSGPGGIYTKRATSFSFGDAGSQPGATTFGLIQRSGTKPRSDDLVTITAAPDHAVGEVGETYTIQDVDGGGRLGPLWQFTMTRFESNAVWSP